MTNKKSRPFSPLKLDSIEDKIEKIEKPEIKEKITQDKKVDSKPASEKPKAKSEELSEEKKILSRMQAMQMYGLKPDTQDVNAPLLYDDVIRLQDVLKKIYKKRDRIEGKRYWTQERLAAHYILQGIEKDEKKIKETLD